MSKNLRLTHDVLDVSEVYAIADNARNGAVVLMSGMVRNQTGGRAVDYLDYQAYESMALQVFQEISDRCHQKFPDVTEVVIHHRLGKLKIGEISVLVAVGSPHRAEAFEACRYAIDTLKIDAPIWKKEFWLDGISSWVNCPI
ncbi:molybdenum cofactor biosynthesis protein MoaE [Pseudanabaena galeata UHCC 0370]|uniref:Molybdenum cofactor biosynthesis protein MoaE n=1 Tax=Pseudanabaena galeata UHCC 0370 TaxID=3110310 RepID=A0ABU5THD0_9CYAN|nr:molybdenum cofactor biosynthesis protein MoaE [Pseudanabaena galeata]MEA5477665.1 molybdenum cofactor biosynthesis protein MoaE [Pseudanabaena galeata UHCC 0370]